MTGLDTRLRLDPEKGEDGCNSEEIPLFDYGFERIVMDIFEYEEKEDNALLLFDEIKKLRVLKEEIKENIEKMHSILKESETNAARTMDLNRPRNSNRSNKHNQLENE